MNLHTNAIQMIEAKIGLVSNNRELVTAEQFFSVENQKANPAIWSILTALPSPKQIPFDQNSLDSYFYVLDQPGVELDVIVSGDKCIIIGDFSHLESSVADLRWNIYGNVGVFFPYSLVALEKYHQIHSFHASALYNPKANLLLIVLGSSGSGKTVLQLEALLNQGYEVFTTEMTHFKITDEGCTFYKGSVFDNIRIGNLVYDFPQAIDRFNIDLPEVEDKWNTYLAVDFSPWSTEQDKLVNPDVVLLFPKIESSRTDLILNANPSQSSVYRSMFENASEKICKSQTMYSGYPAFGSFDSQGLAQQRLADVRRLADSPIVKAKIKMLAGPKDCWAWESLL